eukprot:364044-Chlamydomonas_euryale.AAC.2
MARRHTARHMACSTAHDTQRRTWRGRTQCGTWHAARHKKSPSMPSTWYSECGPDHRRQGRHARVKVRCRGK